METSSSAAFRLKYRRRGWSPSRIKSSDVFVSMRRAVSTAHKLINATSFYSLEPIEELWVERGTILWDTGKQEPVDGIDLSKQLAPVRAATAVAPDDRRYWDSDDFTRLFIEVNDRVPTVPELLVFIEKEAPGEPGE